MVKNRKDDLVEIDFSFEGDKSFDAKSIAVRLKKELQENLKKREEKNSAILPPVPSPPPLPFFERKEDLEIPTTPPVPPIPPNPPLPEFTIDQEEESAGLPISPKGTVSEKTPQFKNAEKRQKDLQEALKILEKLRGRGAYHTKEEQFYLDAIALKEGESSPVFHPFSRFYPTISDLGPAQKAFYLHFRNKFLESDFIEADEGYHLLLLYEIINHTITDDPEKALSYLQRLLVMANSAGYPAASHILFAFRDLVLYDLPEKDYFPLVSEADPMLASRIFALDILADPKRAADCGLSILPAVDALCRTKFSQSPFYRKEKECFERTAKHLLLGCDQRYEAAGGFLERFGGKGVGFYAPFSKLLFAAKRPCRLEGPYLFGEHLKFVGQDGKIYVTLRHLERDREFTSLLSMLFKALECLLREKKKFSGRLKYPDSLPKGLQQTVKEAVLAAEAEEKEANRPVFSWNEQDLSRLRKETDDIRARLILELNPESEEDFPETEEEELPPPFGSISWETEKQEQEQEKKEEKRESSSVNLPKDGTNKGLIPLNAAEEKLLLSLLQSDGDLLLLEQAAKECHMMPLAFLDRLNEKLFEVVGDSPITEEDGRLLIWPEYKEILEEACFSDRKDG